jgi:hypothetical protein
MFVRQNQQQFRNSNADVQIFYGSKFSTTNNSVQSWNKPIGVSNIYIMLIGAAGGGNGTAGGGSGAVTVWYGAAQNVPDILFVRLIGAVGNPGTNSAVIAIDGAASNIILSANGGISGSTGGAAMTANQFTAMGFFQSVAGQNGSASNLSASATTFLSAGTGTGTVTSNYGNSISTSDTGFFQLQPVIVGIGSSGNKPANSSFGCGGGISSSLGGPALALIASW